MLLPQIYKYVKTNETTPDVPAYDLKDFNVETALSFSYSNSGSEMITFVGKHSRLNESSSLTDKNGCSYSNICGTKIISAKEPRDINRE